MKRFVFEPINHERLRESITQLIRDLLGFQYGITKVGRLEDLKDRCAAFLGILCEYKARMGGENTFLKDAPQGEKLFYLYITSLMNAVKVFQNTLNSCRQLDDICPLLDNYFNLCRILEGTAYELEQLGMLIQEYGIELKSPIGTILPL